jgi:hypothetical protein
MFMPDATLRGGFMTRFTTTLAIVLAWALASVIAAQETRSKTVVKGNTTQMTTYTGCIEAGTQSKTNRQ